MALIVTTDILATSVWFFAIMIAAQALEPKTTVGLSRGSPFVVIIFPLISKD